MPLLVLAAAMLLVTMGASPGAAAPPRMGATGLQEEVDELLAEHVGVTTPGAMVAVVGPEGPLVLEAEGWADPLARSRLTLDSRTPVASVTKVVTSLTALRLHHEGLLDLDADIRGDLPLTDRREDAARTPVTGRHLLTHHSGLSEPLLVHPQAPDSQLATLRDVLEQNPPVLDHPADIGLHYSPLHGHTLLGAMIEDATGISFDEAAARWVLDPVGAGTAGFDGPSTAAGDVTLTGRDGSDRVATPWPNVPQRPAATLTWSTHDAAALLDALITPDSPLPAPVVEEATTTTVRPAHGGGGHTQVFFEGRRAEVPVLEHAGANGLAWLALVPEAEIGVFAAVTTEDSEAAAFTESVLETVADWSARSGLADRTPVPEHGAPTITPPWALPHEPADPTGTYQQRLFAGQGPELLLRTATGQVTITRDGDDVLMGQRRLAPSGTPGRWCDQQGCVAAVRSGDGAVTIQRSDRAMLEQTLVAAPWWTGQRFVLAAVAGAALIWVLALGGAARAWWRRRRGADVSPAVSRPLALAWGSVSLAVVAATVLLLGSVLTAPSMRWIHAEGPAVWMLRLLTLAQLLLGAAWTLRAAARRHRLGRWSRALVPPALLIGLAVSVVLISWALPSSAL